MERLMDANPRTVNKCDDCPSFTEFNMPTARLSEGGNRRGLENSLAEVAKVLGSVYTQPTSSDGPIPSNYRVLRIIPEFRAFGILVAMLHSAGFCPNRS